MLLDILELNDFRPRLNERAQYLSFQSPEFHHKIFFCACVIYSRFTYYEHHVLYFLQLSPSEQSAIAAAAANPSSVLGGKITLKGENFMVLRADDSAIYCRKVRSYFLMICFVG